MTDKFCQCLKNRQPALASSDRLTASPFRSALGPAAGCGGTLEAASGGFASPSYPRDYPPDSDCTYILLALAEKRIQLTFTSFNTEQDPDCQKDSVEVSRALGKDSRIFCSGTELILTTMATVIM